MSPCIGICELEHDGLCAGCLRTGDEIMRWGAMPDDERTHVMNHVLPLREMTRDTS
ncbi:MAG: DUF1289 domain-containing protein [Dokdonella sp.]